MARLYATVADLADYLVNQAPPPGAERLLARATELVDEALIGAIYNVDGSGMPTDATIADALKRATCAQAQYMAAGGDETGALAAFTQVQVGGVSYSRNATASGSAARPTPRHAPQALSVLQVAGLLPAAPRARSGPLHYSGPRY